MNLNQIAAQLYTVREHIQTPQDIRASMKKVRSIGYRAVQVSGMGPVAPKELKQILDGEGLICAATHEGAADILKSPHTVADKLAALGCSYTAYPFPSNVDLNDENSVKELCLGLNASGKVLHESGIVLCYHNHNGEFRKLGNRLVLDMLYSDTDPRYLQGEIDTYWVQSGGGDPVAWCTKLSGRLPVLHMKDFGIDTNGAQAFREIGSGNLEWGKIIPAAENAGCKWFIVEQDAHWLNNDPFESLKASFEWLRANAVR